MLMALIPLMLYTTGCKNKWEHSEAVNGDSKEEELCLLPKGISRMKNFRTYN
jgi:hypothetical protein